MRNLERAVIYTGLAAAIGLGLGWSGIGAPAVAQSGGSTAAQAQAVRIATVDVLDLVVRQINSPKYQQVIQTNTQQVTQQLQARVTELQAMQQQLQNAAVGSPEQAELEQRFYAKQQEFQAAQQQAQYEAEAFNTRQVAEAYRLAVEAAQGVGKTKGFTHVFASRTGEISIRADNLPGAMQEILAKPVIMAQPVDGGEVDITADVAEKLGLPRVAEPVEPMGEALPTPAAPDAPAAPAAGDGSDKK